MPLTGTAPRIPLKPLPAEVMQVTGPEAAAMSAVAPLVGTTPRTVKRFVNTYRLLKARSAEWDPRQPDEGPDGHLRVHEVAAFLLAVVTGHPAAAGMVLAALAEAPEGTAAETTLADLAPPQESGADASLAAVRAWLAAHRPYADAHAGRYEPWAREVARFSFLSPHS